MGFNPGPGGGGSSSIAGSTDVTLSSVQDDQVLTYDTGADKWQNKDASTLASPLIWWNGTDWLYPGPAGAAITARPSSRTDYFFQFVDTIGDAPFPEWALVGDTLDKKISE